jgi:hypothetical protein
MIMINATARRRVAPENSVAAVPLAGVASVFGVSGVAADVTGYQLLGNSLSLRLCGAVAYPFGGMTDP